MNDRPTVAHGAWPSPLTVERAVASSRGLRDPWFDGDVLYWIETRPEESGRSVVMRREQDGSVRDVTPAGFNVRTRVHEYGGGAYTVCEGLVVFSNFGDNRLYRHVVDAEPVALTPEAAVRFADLRIDVAGDRVLCVVEDHRAGDRDPVNTLGAVSLSQGSIETLVAGADFFSDPRLSPTDDGLAWLRWDRPNMPWDGCELWTAHVAPDGALTDARRVAGGPRESIVGPSWARDGALLFSSDRSGWWNLNRLRGWPAEPELLAPMDAEFGGPQWVFGWSYHACLADGRIAAIGRSRGRDRLYVLAAGKDPEAIETPYIDLHGIVATGNRVAFVGAGPLTPSAVAILDLGTGALEEVRRNGDLPVDRAYLSEPCWIEFPTDGGETAYANLYEPVSPDVVGPSDERPPLLVFTHGGPTAHAGTEFNPDAQFFAGRGFAVVDVDYRGSTGYGRAYRERLNGNWGVVDLADCTAVARWLAAKGTVDAGRMAIRGGSAGGYTTLCALCFGDAFAAGTSLFGVGDLEALARDTHKFESRYLDYIVAPYPKDVSVYRSRSPINFVDKFDAPLLVLQGTEDRVVPPAQADDLVAALARNGVPYAYILFEGEGHGFRKAENIRRALEAEISFYGQVFGFTPAGDIAAVDVHGLEAWRVARGAGVPGDDAAEPAEPAPAADPRAHPESSPASRGGPPATPGEPTPGG